MLQITSYEARKFDFSRIAGLSERALDIHRGLYEGYVKETNVLLPFIYAEQSGRQELLPAERLRNDGLVRRFAFEYNGMVLHELFFDALRGRSAAPASSGRFMKSIEKSFGSFDNWQGDIRKLAQTRGIGWIITARLGKDLGGKEQRLSNIWVDAHSHGVAADWKPILAFDLWEHAYLIDFKPSERSVYLETLFDNVDWEIVEARCG